MARVLPHDRRKIKTSKTYIRPTLLAFFVRRRRRSVKPARLCLLPLSSWEPIFSRISHLDPSSSLFFFTSVTIPFRVRSAWPIIDVRRRTTSRNVPWKWKLWLTRRMCGTIGASARSDAARFTPCTITKKLEKINTGEKNREKNQTKY